MTAMAALALRALCFLDRDRLVSVPTEDGAKVRCHDDGYWFLREIVQGAVGMLVKILLIVVCQ
jgi:hypothetical protein